MGKEQGISETIRGGKEEEAVAKRGVKLAGM